MKPLLASCVLFMSACRTVPPESPPRVYDPASTLSERFSEMKMKAIKENTSKSSLPALPERRRTGSPSNALQLAEGISFLEQGNLAEAHRRAMELWSALDAERALTLDEDLRQPPYRDVALLLGITEAAQGDRSRGLLILERLIRNNPAWEPPYLALADAYGSRQAHDLAERVARAGVDRVAEASATLYALWARELRQGHDAQGAVRVVERGLRRYPGDAHLLLWRGILDDDAGRTVAACEHFDLAYTRAPESAAVAHNQALCQTRRGDWDKAMVVLKLSLAQHPREPNLRLLAGNVYFKLGDHVSARKSWLDFLSLCSPGDPRRASVEAALDEEKADVGESASRPVTP